MMSTSNPHQEQIHWSQMPSQICIRQNSRHTLGRYSVKPFSPADSSNSEEQIPAESEGPQTPTVVEQKRREQLEWKQCQLLLETLNESIQAHTQRTEQTLFEVQQIAIELAVAAASHLVFHAIEADQFGVEELVQSAVRHFEEEGSVTVSLHPEDHDLLMKRMQDLEFPPSALDVSFQVNSTLQRGACEVRSQQGTSMRSEISKRLSSIRKHWLEELDDSQIERRKTQESDSSLRRFPDRRETA